MAMTVRQLRAALVQYPDDALVGVHVMDHRVGHRFISVERVDMTPPMAECPHPVVWMSTVGDVEQAEPAAEAQDRRSRRAP